MYKSWKPVLLAAFLTRVFIFPVSAQEKIKSVPEAKRILDERGEVIIRFLKPAGVSISEITEFLSIDDLSNDTVIAYANKKGFSRFLQLNIGFEIIPPPSLQISVLRKAEGSWQTRYPSYNEYVDLMEQLAAGWPSLCSLVEFGRSVQGRKLMALKISADNSGNNEKPAVLYTSTMHGDEPLGFVLMLRLADSLLTGYETSSYIKRLVDGAEIWINPLANPDAAYFISDLSVEGAKRFNSNGVDLNRDFPKIRLPEWDAADYEIETRAMIGLMENIRPVLSANFHGGSELVNYPWDDWDMLHADDLWYRFISRMYADTAQAYSSPGYMSEEDNGIVRGIDWYRISGSRQDFVNYYLGGREVTIELSKNKIPPESTIDNYWNYNKKSLLQYIEQVFTGFTGIVTDSATGEPLTARISLPDHDYDNSFVYSSGNNGIYFRLLPEGDYNAVFKSPGYREKAAKVSVKKGKLSNIVIQLAKDLSLRLYPNPFKDYFYLNIPYSGYDLHVYFTDMLGRNVKVIKQPVTDPGLQLIKADGLAPGYYIIQIVFGGDTFKTKAIKE